MAKAYSMDLRERVIADCDTALGTKVAQLREALGVRVSLSALCVTLHALKLTF